MTGDGKDKFVFLGKLSSMLTPHELLVGDDDVVDALDLVNEKRVRLTIEVIE